MIVNWDSVATGRGVEEGPLLEGMLEMRHLMPFLLASNQVGLSDVVVCFGRSIGQECSC